MPPTYDSIICAVCNLIMTNHRCLQPVKKGLLVLHVVGHVCGKAVCGPCNFRHGNEGIFRCPVHSISDDDDMTDSDVEAINKPTEDDKENEVPKVAKSKNKRATNKVIGKSTKGSKYSAKDLLILSQAFIRTSENAVDGTAKKSSKFWDEVAESYDKLKKQQEAYDSRLRKREKMSRVMLKGDFLSDVDDDEAIIVIPCRSASSLQQKWSKFVQPLVTKFITCTHRNPKGSGEGEDECVLLLKCCFNLLLTLSFIFLLFYIVR